jgi:hypothetical protein
MSISAPTQLSTRKLRILWIVLGALLLVSVTPLWLYHRQVISLSEEKLQDTERIQQSEITRSLASETLQVEQSLHEQLQSQRQVLALTGGSRTWTIPLTRRSFRACCRISSRTIPTFST